MLVHISFAYISLHLSTCVVTAVTQTLKESPCANTENMSNKAIFNSRYVRVRLSDGTGCVLFLGTGNPVSHPSTNFTLKISL
jgi:hypothetical protein